MRVFTRKKSLPVDRVDEAALFQLIDDRVIDKTLRPGQRALVLELGLDKKLQPFDRGTGNSLQDRRILPPGPFQELLVRDLAVLREHPLAEFLVRLVAVHAADERLRKPQRGVALPGYERARGDDPSGDVLEAKVGDLDQLLEAELGGAEIERKGHSQEMHRARLQGGEALESGRASCRERGESSVD